MRKCEWSLKPSQSSTKTHFIKNPPKKINFKLTLIKNKSNGVKGKPFKVVVENLN